MAQERLQLKYYEQVLELVSWKLAAVIGHIDLIKVFLTPDEVVRTPTIETAVRDVLGAIRDVGAAIDVNARGLLKPCKRIYRTTGFWPRPDASVCPSPSATIHTALLTLG